MRAKDCLNFIVTVLLISMSAGRGWAESGIDDPALRTRQTTLDNGLTVLTLEDHTTPVVSFQMWVRVGSSDESRVTGLAHLFEHMMFQGSKNIAPGEHGRLVQARGGRLNASTSKDVTIYHAEIPSEGLSLVIALEAERVANLSISDEMLTSEREVVLEERRRNRDSPSGQVFEALDGLIYTAHPYRRPTIGWHSDVEKTTVEDCQEFFSTYYVPNNITIVIVGDFDSEQALKEIRQGFGSLEASPKIPRNITEEPRQRGTRRATVYFDLRAPILAAAWQAPRSGHADANALDVASEILSGGRSSRFYRRLVYEEQVAMSAHGGYLERADAGMFIAYASVRPEASIDRVEELYMEEIGRMRDEPVSLEELDKAKRQLEVALVSSMKTNKAIAGRIAYDTVILGGIRPLDERLAAIQAVSVEDVQRVAQTYLIDEIRSIVHLVPPPEPVDGVPPPESVDGVPPPESADAGEDQP
jgi:predicted Zn-dependent peptidase